jgi:hypothetical protein
MLNLRRDRNHSLELDADSRTTYILDTSCDHKHTCGKNNICPKSRTYDLAKEFSKVRNFFVFENIKHLESSINDVPVLEEGFKDFVTTLLKP